jgi:hypothetical protein
MSPSAASTSPVVRDGRRRDIRPVWLRECMLPIHGPVQPEPAGAFLTYFSWEM